MKGIHYAIILMSILLFICYFVAEGMMAKRNADVSQSEGKVENGVEGQSIKSDPVVVKPSEKAVTLPPQKTIKKKSGYYQNIDQQNGRELKAALNKLIKNHRVLTYSELWNALRDLDAGDEGMVVLIYQRQQRSASANGGDQGDWNREHLWPRAFGIGRSSIANTDLHHIRASDVRTNGKRGHLYFDETDGEDHGGEKYSYDQDSWEPPNKVKGDIARAMFYMAVRYEKGEANSADLELAEVADFQKRQHGKLSVLLKWHEDDPVSEQERERNNKIYQSYQGNRNPFIDHPEYVRRVFQDR